MPDTTWAAWIATLSVDVIGGSEKIPVFDVTAKYVTPDLISAYTIDQIHGAAVITALTDTHQLSVFTAGDDEKIITFANVSAWIVDELEAIATGTTIISGDKLLYVDGGVLKQIDIDAIVSFVNSENGTLGAQVDALSTATLADTDEYLVEQGGTAKKALFSAIAARVHSQFLAYQQALPAVVAVADADTFYTDDGGTEKKVTATVLAAYMLAENKTAILASAWDDYAALGGAAAAADVFLLERSATGKTVTGANLASYVIATQDSASAATPVVAGDDFLMYRSSVEYKVDADVLATYVLKSAWGYASGNPVATGDDVMIGRAGTTLEVTVDQLQTFVLAGIQATVLDFSGLGAATLGVGDLFAVWNGSTAEKITLANLEVQLWDDFDAYVTALAAVTTPLDADVFYTIQGGTPKKVTADVLTSYIDDELWADAAALTPALAGDDIFVRRSGTSYAMDIDVLGTYINTGVQATVLDFSALAAAVPNAADRFVVDDSGTEKKLTLANLETKLWADFNTYVVALTENTTATGSDKIYSIQSGTSKWVDLDTLATFFDVAAGDVTGPVTTTQNNIPQWDAVTKDLKDGLTLVTNVREAGSAVDTAVPTEQAVREVLAEAAFSELDIDGATVIGEALAGTDLIIVDHGANGTNRSSAISRIKTYIETAGTYENLYVDAHDMVTCTTDGAAALAKNEFGTNDIDMEYFAFDGGATEERIQFRKVMPPDWDRGTIKARFHWGSATSSTSGDTVEWGIKAMAIGNSDAIDVAMGSPDTITDTLLASNGADLQKSEAAEITIGGTPQLGDMIVFEVYRNTDGTDDMTEDAWLFGVEIQYQKDKVVAEW
jgi:hypothetical protein